MTTIELPPLQWPLPILIVGYSAQELDRLRAWVEDYARLAIEQDRARRGEQCPFPILDDDGTVAACVAAGHCGCGATSPQPSIDPADREHARCNWTEDSDGNWDTTCGNTFVIESGTPADNNFHWCCYCGKKLAQASYVEPAAESD